METRRATEGIRMMAAVLILAAAGPVAAQEPVTLESAVRAALLTHPLLEAARARLAAAEAGEAEARSAWLPTLGTQALATRYEEPMVVAPLHGFDPMDPPTFERTLVQGHASADWTVFDGGARSARAAGARAVAAAEERGVGATEDAVIAEAVSSYLAAGTAVAQAAAHERLMGALETERARAALLFEQGKIPRVAVLRAEAALSRGRAEAEAARERRGVALHRLQRVTGLPAERLAGGLAPLSAGETDPWRGGLPGRAALLSVAATTHPEIGRARARAAGAESMVAAARSAYLPRIGVAGRYSAYGSTGTALRPEWNAGVQVSWAAFTGGARGRAVERAEAEARAARADAALVSRRVADAVDLAVAAYRTAVARVDALEAAEAQSAEVARIEALALREGAGVQTDYLRAEAELLQVRAELAEARGAVVEARVGVARATGSLSVGWISGMTGEVER